MTDLELELELMVAKETIREAEEAFDKLRKEYQALRNHTDKLESILRNKDIDFPEILELVKSCSVVIVKFY